MMIVVKILFVILFIWISITLLVAFIRKGKRFPNTKWPFSTLESVRLLSIAKYMDKRGWKFSRREIIGWSIVILLGIAGYIIDRIFLYSG